MSGLIRRLVEAIVGLCLLVAAVAWLSGGCGERTGPGEVELPSALAAEAALAQSAELVQLAYVEEVVEPAIEWASGEVASARHTSVASRVLARIEQVRASAGTSVSEGDVVVILDARDLAARVGAAREGLRSSEARLELAQREHTRTEELVRTGVAPERRLDQTSAERRAAAAEAAGRGEALTEAETAASFAEIRAPVSGRVIDRMAEPGDTAVPGQPLLRIYDPTRLRVEAPVRESLAVRLAVGDPLRVEVIALASVVEGRIDEIVPLAERGSRTLLVKVALPRGDARLLAGLFARVAIPAGERRRLVVPHAAIERVGQLEFAQVVAADGAVERRLVTTGESAGDGRIEVLSGLAASERVAIAPGSSAAKVSLDELTGPFTWGSADNVMRLRRLALSGQPDELGLAAARDAGITWVLDLRLPGERDWDEAAAAERSGLGYRNVPVRGDLFEESAFAEIEAFVEAHPDEQILVHCSSGNRAAAWLTTHLVRRHDMAFQDALAIGRRSGITKAAIAEQTALFLGERAD